MGRNYLIFAVGFCACVLIAPPAHAANCDTTILPTAGPYGGEDSCNYTYVPFSSFTYSQGHISARWAAAYEILEAYLVADQEVLGSYAPGSNVLFTPAQGKQHYDFIGRFKVIATQEQFLAITPIWCVQSSNIPAAFDGCYTPTGGGCSITSTAKNCGLSVTCDGDIHTCGDTCASDNEACCVASTTTTKFVNGEMQKTVTSIEKSRKCPPLPSPSPGPGGPDTP